MSNEMIFQDKRCRGDKCLTNGAEKLELEQLAKLHPGHTAVGICFERSRLSSCAFMVLGEYTPENAEELKAIYSDNGDNLINQENA